MLPCLDRGYVLGSFPGGFQPAGQTLVPLNPRQSLSSSLPTGVRGMVFGAVYDVVVLGPIHASTSFMIAH